MARTHSRGLQFPPGLKLRQTPQGADKQMWDE
jgi:hypothetical protein